MVNYSSVCVFIGKVIMHINNSGSNQNSTLPRYTDTSDLYMFIYQVVLKLYMQDIQINKAYQISPLKKMAQVGKLLWLCQ